MTSDLLYILDEDRSVIPCEDPSEWQRWMAVANRTVCATRVGPYNVSTVFLGADHSTSAYRLLVFETKVFGEPELNTFARCSTWDEAVIQHRRVLAEVNGMPPDELPARKTRQERRGEIEADARKLRAELERRRNKLNSTMEALMKKLKGP